MMNSYKKRRLVCSLALSGSKDIRAEIGNSLDETNSESDYDSNQQCR